MHGVVRADVVEEEEGDAAAVSGESEVGDD
jgi:hypothetical protein